MRIVGDSVQIHAQLDYQTMKCCDTTSNGGRQSVWLPLELQRLVCDRIAAIALGCFTIEQDTAHALRAIWSNFSISFKRRPARELQL
jgi:hypothetical protein